MKKKLVPFICDSEDQARDFSKKLPQGNQWPCLFTESNTTGEKDFEEFFTNKEKIDITTYFNLGVIKQDLVIEDEKLNTFKDTIQSIKSDSHWDREQIVRLFHYMIPGFGHKEKGVFLDSKM